MKLSPHFAERWAKRVGGEMPSDEEILRMIDRSVYVQRFQVIKPEKGKPFRVLALHWVPERDIILKVDEQRRRVVTVLSPSVREEK